MKKLTLALFTTAAMISGSAMASDSDTWKDYDGYDDLLTDLSFPDDSTYVGGVVDIDEANSGNDGAFEHLNAAFQRMSTPSDFKLDIEGLVDEDADSNADILGGV